MSTWCALFVKQHGKILAGMHKFWEAACPMAEAQRVLEMCGGQGLIAHGMSEQSKQTIARDAFVDK